MTPPAPPTAKSLDESNQGSPAASIFDWLPLLSLACIGALTVLSCSPHPPVSAVQTAAAPDFDVRAAARIANWHALAVLAELGPAAPLPQVLAALNLPDIDFEPGSAHLPVDAEPVLAHAARAIAALPQSTRLEVGVHGDGTAGPDADAQQDLTQARAQTVVDHLVAYGAPAQMLVARGYGNTRPIADPGTIEGRFRNDRVEFRLMP